MRIIAGVHRGRKLRVPRGRAVRPTSDRVKEALFNILGPRVVGARVLDLFSGTGNLALEALSRGASEATCVERSRPALAVLRTNASMLGADKSLKVIPLSVDRAFRALAGEGREYDVVLMDPPYHTDQVVPALHGLIEHGLLASGATVVVEHAIDEFRHPELDGQFDTWTRREYGDTALTFLVSAGERQENRVPSE